MQYVVLKRFTDFFYGLVNMEVASLTVKRAVENESVENTGAARFKGD